MIEKDNYIMTICLAAAARASCYKKKVGAVFVNSDYEILATGYNEAPSKQPHCDRKTCLDETGKCRRTAHAEANAIVQAAKNGARLNGSILFVTHFPCHECLKLLINLCIDEIVYLEETSGLNSIYAHAIKSRKQLC